MSIGRPLCCLVALFGVFGCWPAKSQTQLTLPSPDTCSVFLSAQQNEFCDVVHNDATPDGPVTLTLSLTATAGPVDVAGYKISETQNYNGTYIGPLVELRPGDLLKVRFLNALSPAGVRLGGHHHGQSADGVPDDTNLHTHGLIVSPNNATAAAKGDGDNVFVQIGRGQSLDYNIKIPSALPASILDLPSGIIPHPAGLYWYHAHLHGISAPQLSGGMSGLLSIGRSDENVVGPDPASTTALRAQTDVAHLLLRDIQIISTIPPDEANASSAVWVPVADPALCENNTVPASKRLGFCSGSDSTKLWLFTVNGERFPSLSVRSGRNLLLRIGNTSASATYVLSLIDQNAPDVRIPFELLSVDGVVPTIKSGARNQSIAAPTTESIRLMPASRAEIYIRNDQPSSNARRIVLRTEGLHTGSDAASGDNWPEVHLAQIVLEQSPVLIAALSLNLAEHPVQDQVLPRRPFAESPQVSSTPGGCIRDPDSTKLEHRRITFTQTATGWAIRTQIVAPPDLNGVHPIGAFQPDPRATVGPIPFERYLKDDGTVNWDGTDVGSNPRSPKHVCVSLKTGHGQLWEIYNPTRELHNFHIHQSKFRIAAVEDLRRYGIDPQGIITSGVAKLQNAKGTDDLYIWHDTMPIEAQGRVFLVINFDAEEQIGRFVFHCHILEHEDSGLMAPVEVIP